MSRVRRSFFLPCAAATALLAAGFFIGRASAPSLAGTSDFPPPFSRTSAHASESRPESLRQSSPPAVASEPDLENLLTSASSPAAEASACAALHILAATDSARALQLAQAAPTPRQRDEFIRAALQGWAATDPLAAARWALDNVRLGERRLAVESLLLGAIADPDSAIAAARFLCDSDPLLQSDHGNALVSAFASAGRFDLAAQFASTASGDFRAHWLSTAFSRWSQFQPEAAFTAAQELADASARTEAFQGAITGWAMSDPAALVARAEKFPSGEIRSLALREGLQQWVALDPVAAAAWMDRLDPSRDLDAGAAAVATTAVIAQKKPDVAASWAESIVDPELRANTLLDFIRLWAERDPAAARSYASTTPALRPETRAVALASFSAIP